MTSATAIRLQIEAALANRIPSALTPLPRIIRLVSPTGVDEVNELLNGGLPVGAISEFAGPECSGRTSLALSFVAQVSHAGSVCAWIDVCDALNPESAAAAGVDLKRLLWVRCGASEKSKQRGEAIFHLDEKYLDPPVIKKGLHGGGFGPHPRTEVKGLSDAVGKFLRPEVLAPRCADPQPRTQHNHEPTTAVSPQLSANPKRHTPSAKDFAKSSARAKPWSRIEQALRVTDLLLQAGGFAAIVLDMAGIAPEYSSRIPMATWFRYRAIVERSQTSLLLLTQHPCAKSSGELLMRFQPGEACRDESTVFTGVEYHVEVDRRRFAETPTNVISIRKPPRKETGATWRGRSPWAGSR
jgi:recombination protein RecA